MSDLRNIILSEERRYQIYDQFDENFKQAVLNLENKNNSIFKIQFYQFLDKFLTKRNLKTECR